MKRRFAAHYIYLSGLGYLKQGGIEVIGNRIARIFLLDEEIEDTEWLPGIIALLESSSFPVDEVPVFLKSVPCDFEYLQSGLSVYHFFPFDFTCMRPVSGTQHRQLL